MTYLDIKTAKAAILVKQNSPLVIEDIQLPDKLEYGQIFVKMLVSGICGSQLGEISGAKGEDKYLPHLLGHEGCGIVKAIGPGVETVKIDDKVVLHWRAGSGIQSKPPKYKFKGHNLNAGWVTTFNEYAIVSENRCTSIPGDLDPEIGSLLGCAITTGFGVVENNAKLKIGQSIVVYGSGGIGLSIIQAAKAISAWPIIAVDIFENRLSLAKDIGATHAINAKLGNAENKIREILKNKNLNVFVDNTGIPSIIELGYSIVDRHGIVVLVGVPKIGNNINIFSLPLHFGKTIVGSHGGESNPDLDIPRYINHFMQNKVDPKEIITKRFDLQNINKAIESIKSGSSAGRVIIELSQEK